MGGYDITEMPASERVFPVEKFTYIDLSQPLGHAPRRYDLAVSTEVAEHLPRQFASNFIGNLTKFSDVILFGAAVPYQGGVGHANENWVEYWNTLFRAHEFECFDFLRPLLWNNPAIHFYYRQNTMLFVHRGAMQPFLAKGLKSTERPLSLIHPEMLLQAVNRAVPPTQRRLERDAGHFYDVVYAKSPVELPDQAHDYGKEDLWFENLTYRNM